MKPVTSNKKRKLNSSLKQASKIKKVKGKEKAYERPFVPLISGLGDEEQASDETADEGDVNFYNEHAVATTSFLERMDFKGIARSKKETLRLHKLSKPARPKAVEDDDLPSIDSAGSEEEDLEDWNSAVSSTRSDEDEDALETQYERRLPLKRRRSWDGSDEETKATHIQRLPIKLANGRIQSTGAVEVAASSSSEDEMENEPKEAPPAYRVSDVATGARFGRAAVIDVVRLRSRKERIAAAKEQLAGICQDILAEPETNLGLLRRLHTFSLPSIPSLDDSEPVQNDVVIRKLAILSQVAVFRDILPGYRVRQLTDKEKAEKVSQAVARTRDWEHGLVGVYQSCLRILADELKGGKDNELRAVATEALCTLLVEKTQFNFRSNIMAALVGLISRKSWDESSESIARAFERVFRADVSGDASLDLVRLLNRMIKERRFAVHPRCLHALVHVRLGASDARASREQVDRPEKVKRFDKHKKGKKSDPTHLSKKARKVAKENKAIEAEMREAAVEVDREEAEAKQTETLKLLFVLYFSVLKAPVATAAPLLSAALSGVSRHAHRVNIDFFKDLLAVLRTLSNEEELDAATRLQCISTAFQLLSGQGEALVLDLDDFVTKLYALLPLICTIVTSEDAEETNKDVLPDALMRAVELALSPRHTNSPARLSAFAHRLLSISLHLPPPLIVRILHAVRGLVTRVPSLLADDDDAGSRSARVNREVDNPQLANALGAPLWQLAVLGKHCHPAVREEVERLK